MSNTKRHLGSLDTELYRAILDFDYEPYEWVSIPGGKRTRVPTGPVQVRQRIIGPYFRLSDIKSYITRHRGRWNSENLRINRIERVSGWEPLDVEMD